MMMVFFFIRSEVQDMKKCVYIPYTFLLLSNVEERRKEKKAAWKKKK